MGKLNIRGSNDFAIFYVKILRKFGQTCRRFGLVMHKDFVNFIQQGSSSKEYGLHLLDYASLYRLKLIQEFVGDVNGKSVLDLGCGNGALSLLLWYLGAKVHSVDISEQALVSTRNLRSFNERTSHFDPYLSRGDATKLPFRSQMFDIVFCIETLEHLRDDRSAIEEIKRITKLGGTVILAVPFDSKVPSNEQIFGTYKHYSFNTLKERFFSRGFRLMRAVFWCFPLLPLLDLLRVRTFFAALGFLAKPTDDSNKDNGKLASSLTTFYQSGFWRRLGLPLLMTFFGLNKLFQNLPYSNDVFLILLRT